MECVEMLLENKFEEYGLITEEKSKPIQYIEVSTKLD